MKRSPAPSIDTTVFRSRLVDIVVNGRTCQWRELVNSSVSDDYRVRIFTDPERRARHVRQFYKMLRKVYIGVPQESLDYAMEAYILGFIEPFDVYRVACLHHDSLVQSDLFEGF